MSALDPPDLAAIRLRHAAVAKWICGLSAPDDSNTRIGYQAHADRGALLDEVERLQRELERLLAARRLAAVPPTP